MKRSRIYRLEPDSDYFQSLHAPDPMEDLRMLFTSDKRMGKRWGRFVARFDGDKPRSRAVGDFPSWATYPLVVSAPGWDALTPLISSVVEALPFVVRHRTRELPYFVMHVLDVVDCLDRREAELHWVPEEAWRPPYVFAINKYAFVPGRVQGHEIFRIPEKPDEVFCSEAVRHRIVGAKLRGLRMNAIPL